MIIYNYYKEKSLEKITSLLGKKGEREKREAGREKEKARDKKKKKRRFISRNK